MQPHHRKGRATAGSLRSGLPRPALAAGTALALVVLVALLASLLSLTPLASPGPLGDFLDTTVGVLTLVSLTASVVWGLIASARTFLAPRSRLLSQAVHRAMGTASLAFLVLHIAVKTARGHAGLRDTLFPFSPLSTSVLISLGALAGQLMVQAAATGVLRSAFAGRARAAHRWRKLHACAYPAWCLAIVHGLKSGRAPAPWVTTGYVLCLAAVACALVARVLLLRRRARTPARHACGPPADRHRPPVPPRPPLPDVQLPAAERPSTPLDARAALLDEAPSAAPQGGTPLSVPPLPASPPAPYTYDRP